MLNQRLDQGAVGLHHHLNSTLQPSDHLAVDDGEGELTKFQRLSGFVLITTIRESGKVVVMGPCGRVVS